MVYENLLKYYNDEDYMFIFDRFQKNFYLKKGLTIVDSDINKKTNKLCWIFIKKETNLYYGEWLDICKSKHSVTKD